jgi:hypothetical protein
LSDAIESGLKKVLETAYEGKAKELGVGIGEIEKAKGITVRVISHVDKKYIVRDEVR